MLSKAKENIIKYINPPTIDQIESVLKKQGVSAARFELIFGIPTGTIRQVRIKGRSFPAKFWHLIFEPFQPQSLAKSQNRIVRQASATNVVTKSKSKSSKDDRISSLFS